MKLNNKGFSMVEILASIAIFDISRYKTKDVYVDAYAQWKKK